MKIAKSNGEIIRIPIGQIKRITFETKAEVKRGAVNSGIVALPNPAHTTTAIRFDAVKEGTAEIEIANVRGVTVRRLTLRCHVGENRINWDLRDETDRKVVNGIYNCIIRSGNQTWSTLRLSVLNK